MFEAFTHFVDFMWGIPLIIVIVAAGVWFTIATGGFQFTHFFFIARNVFRKDNRAGDNGKALTPFQAVCVAIGGTVGVSNISGVATAIVSGGPGALFWIWVAAMLGMIIKMAEVSLAVYYRESNPDGTFQGGPTYYMKKALGMERGWKCWKVLALIFGLGICLTWPITIQNYTTSEAIGYAFGLTKQQYIIPSLVLVVSIYIVTFGGLKKIGIIASYVTPFMCIFYIVCGLIVLGANYANIPGTFALIFKGAFTKQAATGGFLGASVMAAMRFGFARSVYSNEAGWGTSPMVHATAYTDHPIKQGLLGAFEVFTDTILVCSMTGLVIICTGMWQTTDVVIKAGGAPLTLAAFSTVVGHWASIVIALSIFLFALTTNTGWFTYYTALVEQGFKPGKARNIALKILLIGNPLWGLLILVANVYSNGTPKQIWTLADFSSLVPTFVNVFVLLIIGKKFLVLLKDYRGRYLGEGTYDPSTPLFYEDELKQKEQNKQAQ